MNGEDPRVKRTRKLLLDALVELMAEKSFQSITVQDVAERATVNRATFYAHFEDKFALLDALMHGWFQQTLARKQLQAASFSLNNLRLLVLAVFESLSQIQDHCKPADRAMDPLFERKLQQELYDYLLAWIKPLPPAEMPTKVPPETTATLLSWAIFGAGVQWSRDATVGSLDEMASQVLAQLTGGLARAVNLAALERREQNGKVLR